MSRKVAIGQSEYLFYNAIDSEIKAFLRPLNLIQSAFFMSLYRIYDNFITYNSIASIAVSFLSVVVTTVIYSLRVVLNDFTDSFLYINHLFDSVYYGLGFAMIFSVCIGYKDCNINIVLKIQDLFRSRAVSHKVIRHLTKVNWFHVYTSAVFFIISTVISLFLHKKSQLNNFYDFIYHFILLAFDVNVIYATQIVRVLTFALRQWTVDLKHYRNIRKVKLSKKENWKYKQQIYTTILETFQIAKDAFQLMILYHCTETFVHATLYVYSVTIIFGSSEYRGGLTAAALLISWILKNFIYETLLSVEVERFLIAVNDATVNSILQMSNKKCSEQEKQMHKNVVRLSRLSHKFAVCNLFGMEAAMPPQLLSLIATYTIVLLQFVLL